MTYRDDREALRAEIRVLKDQIAEVEQRREQDRSERERALEEVGEQIRELKHGPESNTEDEARKDEQKRGSGRRQTSGSTSRQI